MRTWEWKNEAVTLCYDCFCDGHLSRIACLCLGVIMSAHIEKARNNLVNLASLAKKTEAAEIDILKKALLQLKDVQSQLADLGDVTAKEDKHDEYLSLIRQRGQLEIVVSKAKKTLGY